MTESMTQERKAAREAIEEGMQTVQHIKEGELAAAAQQKAPSRLYLYATGASILGSAILFLRKNRDAGIFVGLWAPTILSMGLFYKLLRPSREV
jgi:hypothetical protein